MRVIACVEFCRQKIYTCNMYTPACACKKILSHMLGMSTCHVCASEEHISQHTVLAFEQVRLIQPNLNWACRVMKQVTPGASLAPVSLGGSLTMFEHQGMPKRLFVWLLRQVSASCPPGRFRPNLGNPQIGDCNHHSGWHPYHSYIPHIYSI